MPFVLYPFNDVYCLKRAKFVDVNLVFCTSELASQILKAYEKRQASTKKSHIIVGVGVACIGASIKSLEVLLVCYHTASNADIVVKMGLSNFELVGPNCKKGTQ